MLRLKRFILVFLLTLCVILPLFSECEENNNPPSTTAGQQKNEMKKEDEAKIQAQIKEADNLVSNSRKYHSAMLILDKIIASIRNLDSQSSTGLPYINPYLLGQALNSRISIYLDLGFIPHALADGSKIEKIILPKLNENPSQRTEIEKNFKKNIVTVQRIEKKMEKLLKIVKSRKTSGQWTSLLKSELTEFQNFVFKKHQLVSPFFRNFVFSVLVNDLKDFNAAKELLRECLADRKKSIPNMEIESYQMDLLSDEFVSGAWLSATVDEEEIEQNSATPRKGSKKQNFLPRRFLLNYEIFVFLKLSELYYFQNEIDSAMSTLKSKCLRLDPDFKPCFIFHKFLRTGQNLINDAKELEKKQSYQEAIAKMEKFLGFLQNYSKDNYFEAMTSSSRQNDEQNPAKYLLFFKKIVQEHPGILEAKLDMCRNHKNSIVHDVSMRTDENIEKGIKVCEGYLKQWEAANNGNQGFEDEKYTIAALSLAEILLYSSEDSDDFASNIERAEVLISTIAQNNLWRNFPKSNSIGSKIQHLQQQLSNSKRKKSRKNYYKILGVSRDASKEDIRKAYRKLSAKMHPDRYSSSQPEEKKKAENKFIEINEAFTILSDEEKRRRYDMGENQEGEQGDGQGPGGAYWTGSPFESFFGGGGFPGGGFPGGGHGGGFPGGFHFRFG